MTELLVVKNGANYYRFNKSSFECCTMKKASVFTLDQLNEVEKYCLLLEDAGISADIMKLTIIEELFSE